MTNKEIRLIQEALSFVKDYDQNASFRKDINQKMAEGKRYNGRPVFFYVQMLVIYSPAFRRYYLKLARTPANVNVKYFVKREPGMVEKFLRSCYWENRAAYNELLEKTEPPGIFEESELDRFEQLRQVPPTPTNQAGLETILNRALVRQSGKASLPESVNKIAEEIKSPEQITEKHQQRATASLSDKIKLYGAYMATPEGRGRLVKEGLCTDAEIKELLRSGLVKAPDVVPELNKEGFKSAEEKSKAVREAADRLLKSHIEEKLAKEAPPQPEEVARTPNVEPDEPFEPDVTPEPEIPRIALQPKLKPQPELQPAQQPISQPESTPFKEATLPAPTPPVELPPPPPTEKVTIRQRLSALRQIRAPEPVKNFGKELVHQATQFAIRNKLTVISTALGTGVGIITGNPLAGALGGALAPKIAGGAMPALKGAGAAMKGMQALKFTNPYTAALAIATDPKIRKFLMWTAVGVVTAIFMFFNSGSSDKAAALFPPYQTAYGAPNIPPGGNPNLPPGGGPGPGTGTEISYTIPIRNTAIIPNDVKSQVLKSWPNAKLEFWDYITQWGKDNGWNPAFVLTLWVEESGAQHYQDADPIGCTLAETTSDPRQKLDLSLACLNKFLSAHFSSGYNDSMFPRFMCIYSEGHYPCVFNRNNFPAAIKGWYTIIAGSQSITTPTPSPTLPTNYVASCPVPSGVITCASYGKPYQGGGPGAFEISCRPDSTGNGGHCNTNYKTDVGICNGTEGTFGKNGQIIRTGKSIDITAMTGGVVGNKASDPVYFPTIKGETLKWHFKGDVNAGGNFGWIRLFQSEPTQAGVWSIHFVHANLNSPHFDFNQLVEPGRPAATMYNYTGGVHIHVTIGLNVGDSVNDLKDYSSNWLYADRDLGMCVK